MPGTGRSRSADSARSPRSAALLVVGVDLDVAPDAVEMVRVAMRKGVDGLAVPRLHHEQAAGRRLAIVGDERAGGQHIDAAFGGLVEMLAVGAVELGAGR